MKMIRPKHKIPEDHVCFEVHPQYVWRYWVLYVIQDNILQTVNAIVTVIWIKTEVHIWADDFH